MHERVERFRRQVEEHFGGRPGRGSRYPEALRAEAIAITDWAVTRGTRVVEVAERLGLGAATLRRWLASPPDALSELRPVDLIEPEEPQAEEPQAHEHERSEGEGLALGHVTDLGQVTLSFSGGPPGARARDHDVGGGDVAVDQLA